jgi:hypothetical protein
MADNDRKFFIFTPVPSLNHYDHALNISIDLVNKWTRAGCPNMTAQKLLAAEIEAVLRALRPAEVGVPIFYIDCLEAFLAYVRDNKVPYEDQEPEEPAAPRPRWNESM